MGGVTAAPPQKRLLGQAEPPPPAPAPVLQRRCRCRGSSQQRREVRSRRRRAVAVPLRGRRPLAQHVAGVQHPHHRLPLAIPAGVRHGMVQRRRPSASRATSSLPLAALRPCLPPPAPLLPSAFLSALGPLCAPTSCPCRQRSRGSGAAASRPSLPAKPLQARRRLPCPRAPGPPAELEHLGLGVEHAGAHAHIHTPHPAAALAVAAAHLRQCPGGREGGASSKQSVRQQSSRERCASAALRSLPSGPAAAH